VKIPETLAAIKKQAAPSSPWQVMTFTEEMHGIHQPWAINSARITYGGAYE
jgi:hypothetical protein